MTEQGIPNLEGQRQDRIARVALEAWRANNRFDTYDPDVQRAHVGALTEIGLRVDAKCKGKWNSQLPMEVLEEIREDDPVLVQRAERLARNPKHGSTAFTASYLRLFQMLHAGVDSMAALKEKKNATARIGAQDKLPSSVRHTHQVVAQRDYHPSR